MSIDLVGSLDAINRSDASSRTESGESTPPRPEQDDDVAQSPFVPQRARLIPGGPPVRLGEPLLIDVPRFLVEPDRRAFPGQSLPGDMPPNPTFHPDIDALEATLLVSKAPVHRSRPTSCPLSDVYRPHACRFRSSP